MVCFAPNLHTHTHKQSERNKGSLANWHPCTEYAKSGVSRCRKCGRTIGKDEARIGWEVKSSMHDGFDTLWYHPNCIIGARDPKLPKIKQLSALRGWTVCHCSCGSCEFNDFFFFHRLCLLLCVCCHST